MLILRNLKLEKYFDIFVIFTLSKQQTKIGNVFLRALVTLLLFWSQLFNKNINDFCIKFQSNIQRHQTGWKYTTKSHFYERFHAHFLYIEIDVKKMKTFVDVCGVQI